MTFKISNIFLKNHWNLNRDYMENVNHFLLHDHFYHINSSSQSSSIFDFFWKCLKNFIVELIYLLGEIYFYLLFFEILVNGTSLLLRTLIIIIWKSCWHLYFDFIFFYFVKSICQIKICFLFWWELKFPKYSSYCLQ